MLEELVTVLSEPAEFECAWTHGELHIRAHSEFEEVLLDECVVASARPALLRHAQAI